jgi:hypothetical protein
VAETANGEPGMTGALPTCKWVGPEGQFVQAASVDASTWAKALPELIQVLQASGQFTDSENMRRLEEAAELVAAGRELDPSEACSLFSRMVELQGRPPGTPMSVSVVPSQENPQVVTGQICRAGIFTSVTVADQLGLDLPLPIDEVAAAVKSAHRRGVG